MRVCLLTVFPAALALIFVAPARQMRADVVFSNFGPSQTYQGASWWNVGSTTNQTGTQVLAFSFSPTQTAALTGADLALALVPPPGVVQTLTPLNVYVESNTGAGPGMILDTLTQAGSYDFYPVTTVVNFTCSGSCTTLDAGTTYWLVAQQTDPSNTTGWFWSFGDTGTGYLNLADSATGPWTPGASGGAFSAFDVTGVPATPAVPEPASLALLASGLMGIFVAVRHRASTH